MRAKTKLTTIIKSIPKHILTKIERLDKLQCPEQKGPCRFYSYLTSINKELVKITVAVKNYRKKWYCKQVAAHGANSTRCWVKDMEYVYFGMGYRVGWYAEGLQKWAKWFEDGKWSDADSKYYNVWATIINPEYVSKFPQYRYSAYQYFQGKCIIEYLKLYRKYPQAEYLLKLGLHKYHDSTMILKKIANDKKFCKWLISNKLKLTEKYFYVGTIMQSYETGKPLERIQAFEECKKRLIHDSDLKPIRELFRGKDLERFFSYLELQKSNPRTYLDYLKACNYLGLDVSLDKNRYPHNFKRWHDIRIDEYHSAKAKADEKERAELYEKFAIVASKYMPLQECKKGGYAVLIATSPADLMREGESLKHCVGRMGYDQKMIREETLIFFIRAIESPDIPFVTVEYSLKSKKVLQCYGDGSKKPDDTVLHYVNKVWLPYANRIVKKLTAAA